MQRQEIRNPQSAIRNSTGSPCIRVLRGREKKCIAGFQPAKVVLTQKELSRLRCRRDAGATIFSHDPCLRGEKSYVSISSVPCLIRPFTVHPRPEQASDDPTDISADLTGQPI